MSVTVQVPGGAEYRVDGGKWTGEEPAMVRLLTAVSGVPRSGYEPDPDRGDAAAVVEHLRGVRIVKADPVPRTSVKGAVY